MSGASSGALPARPIALVGLRGSGKSSVGRALARLAGRRFLDGDERTLEVARRAGDRADSIGALLEQLGQAAFREHEAAALRSVLEPQSVVVLATGGGVVERSDNRAWLERGALCVWLDVPVEVLRERLRRDPTHRPALEGAGSDPIDEVGAVHARRAPLYAAVADLRLDAGEDDVEALAAAVIEALSAGADAVPES